MTPSQTAPTHVASTPLRIASRVTAGLVSLQVVLIAMEVIGVDGFGTFHGYVGYASLISAIVAMALALRERMLGLGRAEFLLAVVLPVLMGIQFFLSTVDVRGPHMFVGGLIVLIAWLVAALVGGKARAPIES